MFPSVQRRSIIKRLLKDLTHNFRGNSECSRNKYISSDIGEKIKRPKLDPVQNNDLSFLNKMRKNEVADITKTAESTTAKDILSEIHSIDQLKDFLRGETESRKVSRKSSFTHKLSQDEWKSLKKEVFNNLMPTKPNKSLKLCQ